MKQALKLGTYLREEYVESMDFLPPSLGNGSERSFSSKFMSDSGELRSSMSWVGSPFVLLCARSSFVDDPCDVVSLCRCSGQWHAAACDTHKEHTAKYSSNSALAVCTFTFESHARPGDVSGYSFSAFVQPRADPRVEIENRTVGVPMVEYIPLQAPFRYGPCTTIFHLFCLTRSW